MTFLCETFILLLQLLTSEYIGDEVEETGTSKEVIRAAETSSTKTETTDNLFFIDTQANIDIEAHGLKVQDEPEVEVYDFSEADIEKELAKMDESSSEESDDNGSSSDESDVSISLGSVLLFVYFNCVINTFLSEGCPNMDTSWDELACVLSIKIIEI